MEKRICPQCNNPDSGPDDDFCWNCGLKFGNCCENPECYELEVRSVNVGGINLPDKFTYCPYCGTLTRYARLGFVEELVFEPQT